MAGITDVSKLHHGPLTQDMRRWCKLPRNVCPGMGTAFCIQRCSAEIPEDCPMTLHPEAFADDTLAFPCATCALDCPCLTQEKAEEVYAWWTGRVRSANWEKANWGNLPPAPDVTYTVMVCDRF